MKIFWLPYFFIKRISRIKLHDEYYFWLKVRIIWKLAMIDTDFKKARRKLRKQIKQIKLFKREEA